MTDGRGTQGAHLRALHAGVMWAAEGGAVGDVLHAWHIGDTFSVPVGRLWSVLRVTRRIAVPTLHRLRATGIEPGPVLDAVPREAFEWLVPAGTARTWPSLRGTVCVDSGTLRCPSPSITVAAGSLPVNGRRWVVPPALGVPPVTDADALCEALAGVLCRLAEPFVPGHHHAGGPAEPLPRT